MRTPAELADQINSLNCHARGGGYGPVTERQMQDIYAEARKMEWTDAKPDKEGWWAYKWEDGSEEPMRVWYSSGHWRAGGFRIDGYKGQWSTRPIEMPGDKEGGK